jgi:hypothetical protein
MYEYIYLINLEGRVRRKIRLIEDNAKCRHLNNLIVKGLCGRCYLHREGGRGRAEPERRG